MKLRILGLIAGVAAMTASADDVKFADTNLYPVPQYPKIRLASKRSDIKQKGSDHQDTQGDHRDTKGDHRDTQGDHRDTQCDHGCSQKEAKAAVDRTIRWAAECLEQKRAEGQSYFGIVQGGSDAARGSTARENWWPWILTVTRSVASVWANLNPR